jgi:putative membrane protein
MPFLVKVAATTLGVWVAVQLVPGIQFTGSLVGLLAVGLILGVINAFARPVVTILSLPFIVLTLGLFLLIINTMMFGLTIWLSDALALGLTSTGFWSTFFGAMVVTIVVWIADAILDSD